MPPTRFTVTAHPTASGWVASCPELDIACEGASEDEARRTVVEAITLLQGFGPSAEVDARRPEPPRVSEIQVRSHRR